MSKLQMAVFVGLGSLISVLIWSFVGGCQRSNPVLPPPATGRSVDLPVETEEDLRREGVITDQVVSPSTTPIPLEHPRPSAVVAPAVRYHVVQKGETLWGVSRQYGVSLERLQKANGISDPSALAVGQRLVIPGT